MILNSDYTFNGERPSHVDCQILLELGRQSDLAGAENRDEAYAQDITGKPFEEIMNEAVSRSIDLIKSSGPDRTVEQLSLVMGVGEPIMYIPYYMVAWVAGLGAGLEQIRGMEMPEGAVDTPDKFWDLDGYSVAYAAHERCSAAANSHEELAEIENSKPLVLVGGCYMDGYVIGCGFDAKKNPHIEGRSVLL